MAKGRKLLRSLCFVSKEQNVDEHKTPKLKKKWHLGKPKPVDSYTSSLRPSQPKEIKLTDSEHGQNKDVNSAAIATAQAAAAAAQAAAEVVRLTSNPVNVSEKSREEVAAIKIQTASRGWQARRDLCDLRRMDRLKSTMNGDVIRQQAATTLRCIRTLGRIQSEIRVRRSRMVDKNLALRKCLQRKHESEADTLSKSMDEQWDDSPQSKLQTQSSVASKHEGAIRRERALAYAFTRQLKTSSKSSSFTFMDPNYPQWGWSLLECWVAARPQESHSMLVKEPCNDHASERSPSQSVAAARIMKTDAKNSRGPSGRQSPSTPPSKMSSIMERRIKSASPKGKWCASDDSRSLCSVRSERIRRRSIAGSSVRDDESLMSSHSVPNYMTPTESARLKSRLRSPLSSEGSAHGRPFISSAKKQLFFPVSEGPRRDSTSSYLNNSSIKDILFQSEP